jgi:hypothetical protein
MKPHLFAIALSFLIAGSFWGEIPSNPVVKRGEYFVLEGDFHVHTRFSDGFLSPFEVVLYAKREALDVIGLTEHNMVFPGKLAHWFSPKIDGPIVLVSEEVTTRDHHLIAVGLTETVPALIPLTEAIDRVHAQGGIAIGAHPVSKYWKAFDPIASKLDGAEVMHPIGLRGGGSSEWRWSQMKEFYEREAAKGNRLTAIGSSDYHFFRALGVCRTIIFAKEPTEAGALAAMKEKRTVVFGPNGEKFGDPAMIALLEAEPLAPKIKAPGYEATGWFDGVTRTLAFFGVAALVFLRRR